jgi:hypothetical protein
MKSGRVSIALATYNNRLQCIPAYSISVLFVG